jgi:hypothetical protein
MMHRENQNVIVFGYSDQGGAKQRSSVQIKGPLRFLAGKTTGLIFFFDFRTAG